MTKISNTFFSCLINTYSYHHQLNDQRFKKEDFFDYLSFNYEVVTIRFFFNDSFMFCITNKIMRTGTCNVYFVKSSTTRRLPDQLRRRALILVYSYSIS